MLYALMGVGLSLILGILNLPNFAHGTLYALGAYLLFAVTTWLGSFWLALLVAPLGVAAVGVVIELGGMRRLYAAGHDYQLLLTFGLALILEQVIILIWGPIGMSLLPPRGLGGALDLGVTFYPRYRLFAMVVAGLLILATWLFLEKTRLGAIIRAGIEDKDMVAVLGVNIHRVFTLTFALGAWLAGVAGALMVPVRGLTPTMGGDILGIAFVVVALGGLGNLPGAMLAGIIIGLAQSLVALVWPVASIVVIFAVMAVVLLLRPQGLFGTR
jgi:branched-chain amino acid transport system permease protein